MPDVLDVYWRVLAGCQSRDSFVRCGPGAGAHPGIRSRASVDGQRMVRIYISSPVPSSGLLIYFCGEEFQGGPGNPT